MNDTRFTDNQVRDMLRTVVAENPDFVYEAPGGPDEVACKYVHDGAPSCLVGHVMSRLGLPLDILSANEGASPCQIGGDLGISVRAADALTEAQDYQDQEYTWSDSLAHAERHWED